MKKFVENKVNLLCISKYKNQINNPIRIDVLQKKNLHVKPKKVRLFKHNIEKNIYNKWDITVLELIQGVLIIKDHFKFLIEESYLSIKDFDILKLFSIIKNTIINIFVETSIIKNERIYDSYNLLEVIGVIIISPFILIKKILKKYHIYGSHHK